MIVLRGTCGDVEITERNGIFTGKIVEHGGRLSRITGDCPQEVLKRAEAFESLRAHTFDEIYVPLQLSGVDDVELPLISVAWACTRIRIIHQIPDLFGKYTSCCYTNAWRTIRKQSALDVWTVRQLLRQYRATATNVIELDAWDRFDIRARRELAIV